MSSAWPAVVMISMAVGYIRKEGEGQFKKDQILIRLMNDMTLTASHDHASLLWLMVFNATFNNISRDLRKGGGKN
jgi:uncharacterized protein (DUF2267 family)